MDLNEILPHAKTRRRKVLSFHSWRFPRLGGLLFNHLATEKRDIKRKTPRAVVRALGVDIAI